MITYKDLGITEATFKTENFKYGEYKASNSKIENFGARMDDGNFDPAIVQRMIDTDVEAALVIIKRDLDVQHILTKFSWDQLLVPQEVTTGILKTVLGQITGFITDGNIEVKNGSTYSGQGVEVTNDISGNLLSQDRIYKLAEDFWYEYDLDKIKVIFDADGNPVIEDGRQEIELLPGPKGEQGIPGPQGTPGTTGTTGPQGEHGVTGATGATGPTGDKGDTGSSIIAKGKVATKNDLPTSPMQGDAWVVSDENIVYVWEDAAWVDFGPAGSTGPQGTPGTTGPQGIPGTPGQTGPQGIQGAEGKQGIQGVPGSNGADGYIPNYTEFKNEQEKELAPVRDKTENNEDDIAELNKGKFDINGDGTKVIEIFDAAGGVVAQSIAIEGDASGAPFKTTLGSDGGNELIIKQVFAGSTIKNSPVATKSDSLLLKGYEYIGTLHTSSDNTFTIDFSKPNDYIFISTVVGAALGPLAMRGSFVENIDMEYSISQEGGFYGQVAYLKDSKTITNPDHQDTVDIYRRREA